MNEKTRRALEAWRRAEAQARRAEAELAAAWAGRPGQTPGAPTSSEISLVAAMRGRAHRLLVKAIDALESEAQELKSRSARHDRRRQPFEGSDAAPSGFGPFGLE